MCCRYALQPGTCRRHRRVGGRSRPCLWHRKRCGGCVRPTALQGSRCRAVAQVASFPTLTDAKVVAPDGLKTGCVVSTKVVCPALQSPASLTRWQPITCESMAYFGAPDMSAICGMVTVPAMESQSRTLPVVLVTCRMAK